MIGGSIDRMKRSTAFAILVAACSSNSSPTQNPDGNNQGNPDGSNAGGSDGSGSGNPVTITISGIATDDTQNASTPIKGATIAAFKTSDPSTPVMMTTTGSDGTYTMTITANGELDGYIKATAANETDTYLFPPAPLTANFTGADAHMIGNGLFSELTAVEGEKATQGLIIFEVEDATGALVAGAAGTSTPAASKTLYTDPSNGLGLPGATGMTAADGRVFLIGNNTGSGSNPGTVTVGATKAGTTFKSHPVLVFPAAETTTIVTP